MVPHAYTHAKNAHHREPNNVRTHEERKASPCTHAVTRYGGELGFSMDKLCRRDDPGEHHLTPILLWRLPALNNFTPTKIHDTLGWNRSPPLRISSDFRVGLSTTEDEPLLNSIRLALSLHSFDNTIIIYYAFKIIRERIIRTFVNIWKFRNDEILLYIYIEQTNTEIKHTYNNFYTEILTIALTSKDKSSFTSNTG